MLLCPVFLLFSGPVSERRTLVAYVLFLGVPCAMIAGLPFVSPLPLLLAVVLVFFPAADPTVVVGPATDRNTASSTRPRLPQLESV